MTFCQPCLATDRPVSLFTTEQPDGDNQNRPAVGTETRPVVAAIPRGERLLLSVFARPLWAKRWDVPLNLPPPSWMCQPAFEPPEGAEDFSPWRKPWEKAPQHRHPAPEGRKTSFPDMSPVVRHTVLLEKPAGEVGQKIREGVGPVFRPSGAPRILTPTESHGWRRWAKFFRPSGPGEDSMQLAEIGRQTRKSGAQPAPWFPPPSKADSSLCSE